MKCNCKSAPDYHREDCQKFDIYGNLKVEKVFFYPISDLLKTNEETQFVTQGRIKECNFSNKESYIELIDRFDKDSVIKLFLDEQAKQKYLKINFQEDILDLYLKGIIKRNKYDGSYEFHLIEPYKNRNDLMLKEY